jgi:hypothetical protein
MNPTHVPSLGILVTALIALPTASSQTDPVSVVLDAFKTHALVALGDGEHRNEQAHALRVALVRDGRLAGIVNDIVVEFGTARYQEVIDRFTAGEEVPSEDLRRVWQDTAASSWVWDVPIYEDFFRAVRDANAARPAAQRYRVLLGDPPTQWENVKTVEDVLRLTANGNRDRHAADLIRREVLAKNRRALIIYADGHLWRDAGFTTVVDQIETTTHTKVFTVGSSNLIAWTELKADASSWSAPAIVTVGGTPLGARPFADLFPIVGSVLAERWKGMPVEDQYDAIAYYGPPETLTSSELPASICRDQRYLAMRLGRLRFLPPGTPDLAAGLRAFCERVTAK